MLEHGDHRMVYLGAAESAGFSFDVYPGDFTCSATGSRGDFSLERIDQLRLLNVWQDHMAIGSFEAPVSGVYEVSCEGPDAELVIAKPARFMVGWASPQFAMLLVMPVALVAGLVLLLGVVIGHLRRRRISSNL